MFDNIFKPITKDELKQRHEKLTQSIINELINRPDCIKHLDGSYSFKNSVNLSELNLIKLPIKFKQIDGNFYCHDNKLINLKGSPKIVKGGFYCSHNQLTSLQGAPEYVGHYFDCSNNQLISLQGAPEYVGGYFDCSYNQLTSLQGAPEQVDGDFYCLYNKIKFTKNNVKKICNVKGIIYV